MRKWNSGQNEAAWNAAVADMKQHGYTNYDIEELSVMMLSHPALKTKSRHLADNYRAAYYAGILTGIRMADEMLNMFVMSKEKRDKS